MKTVTEITGKRSEIMTISQRIIYHIGRYIKPVRVWYWRRRHTYLWGIIGFIKDEIHKLKTEVE